MQFCVATRFPAILNIRALLLKKKPISSDKGRSCCEFHTAASEQRFTQAEWNAFLIDSAVDSNSRFVFSKENKKGEPTLGADSPGFSMLFL